MDLQGKDIISIAAACLTTSALATSIYWSRRTTLEVARRTTEIKKSEITQAMISRWFSADMAKARAVAHQQILLMVPENSDRSLVDNLVNLPLELRPALPPPESNGLRPSQCLTIILYFFVEMVAYRDLQLIDEQVIRRVFCSLWEFWSPELKLLLRIYAKRSENIPALVTPPWVSAVKEMDDWMAR